MKKMVDLSVIEAALERRREEYRKASREANEMRAYEAASQASGWASCMSEALSIIHEAVK